ncbi:MAG TPA: ABC transporter permease [Clostridiales bacterium]|jgi:ABC-2 type transport system permease protein|nr:ABC transporter permease [Clostridiales bacterium]
MLEIIMKETKEFLRDKSNVFFFFVFPVLLVFVLGNLLSSLDSAEETIGELRVHYMIEAANPADIMAVEGFVQSITDKSNIIFEITKDLDSSKELAGNDKIAAVILFTESPMEIHIYEGMNRIKNRSVNAIMNGFSQINKAVNVLVKNNPKALSNSMNDEVNFIRQKDLGIKRTMVDYYAITMMTMLSFTSIMLGTSCLITERQDKTIRRLKIAPINQVKLFLSKIFGLLPQIILQISILMILSVLFFGANYASNLLDNLYLFLMFTVLTFAVILVGAVYGLFVNVNPMATIFPVLWIMMFISGTYSKEIFIDGITQAMPIYQIQEAAFDLAIFGNYDKANTVIAVCVIISAVLLVIGAVEFSRREEL